MPKILYSSADVRNKIIELFETSRSRRVAITAFVGDGADTYIPNPAGVHLICWPKAGGTNPDAIRQLIDRGAKVYLCKSLHMKLYWTKDKGAVITSANLSQNALGSGNLREIGIWIEPGQLDIDRVLDSINYRKVTKNDLYELDYGHREYHIQNRYKRSENQILTYPDWYGSAHRTLWRICWWSGSNVHLAKAARPLLYRKYGVTDAQDFFTSTKQSDYLRNNWVLCFTDYKRRLVSFSWMYIDQVVRVNRSDKQAYDPGFPYQFIQVWPLKRYPLPPFKLDNRFREAFQAAARKATWDKLELWAKPTPTFEKLVYDNYGKG